MLEVTTLRSRILGGLPTTKVGKLKDAFSLAKRFPQQASVIFSLDQDSPSRVEPKGGWHEIKDPRIFGDQTGFRTDPFNITSIGVNFNNNEQLGLSAILRQDKRYQLLETPSSIIDSPQSEKRSPIELSENTKRAIGENGARRFDEFKGYQRGWDFGRGNPLSANSVRIFEWFLGRLPEIVACAPSLFLTHYGNLQLGWGDAQGNSVEIEFFPNKLEYFIESLKEEDSVSLRDVDSFINRVRSIIT